MMSLLQDKPAAYWLRNGPLFKYLYQQLNAFNNKYGGFAQDHIIASCYVK